MRKKIAPSYGLAFILMIAGLNACFQPEEGCIDVNATNFQVDADRACPDCCLYPVISVNFEHKVVYPDTAYNLVINDSMYFDGAGNGFYIQSLQFYFSEIRLIRPDGEQVGVTDTLILANNQSNGEDEFITVEDNFALVNPAVFGASIMGTFRGTENFSRLLFTQGVPGPANFIDSDEYPLEHPLSDTTMFLDQRAGRLFYRLELLRMETPSDSVEMIIELSGTENLRQVELALEPSRFFFLDPGFNPSIRLRIDYRTWFRDVDLVADPQELIIEKIVNNATESFSVIEITAN